MFARAIPVLLPLLLTSAEAAPFDNLKTDLASCLRFEMDGLKAQRNISGQSKAKAALERCAVEVERLDRADGRRLRGDQGLSPSTWSVIRSVLGSGGSSRRSGPSR